MKEIPSVGRFKLRNHIKKGKKIVIKTTEYSRVTTIHTTLIND